MKSSCDPIFFGRALSVIASCWIGPPVWLAALLVITMAGGCGGGGSAGSSVGQADGGVSTVTPSSEPAPVSAVPSIDGGVGTPSLPAGDSSRVENPAVGVAGADIDCEALADSALRSGGLDVSLAGVRPDDETDDVDAIEALIRSSPPGSRLVFPPGRYLQSRHIAVSNDGVQLIGRPGARIHATNEFDQAIVLAADGAALGCFLLTAATSERGGKPLNNRVAVYPLLDTTRWLKGVQVIGNSVHPHVDSAGVKHASSSAAGIFVYQATGFRIVGNSLVSTLADGIHVTGGASEGEVAYNAVSASGDDMVGIVSYGMSPQQMSAYSIAQIEDWRAKDLVRDVTVHHNLLSGAVWGRGVALIGGERIVIRHNRIDDIHSAAGVIVSRESAWRTWGVRDVEVRDNVITAIQTTTGTAQTGHAAIELQSLQTSIGLTPAFWAYLEVTGVRVKDNAVIGTRHGGIRVSADPSRPFVPPELISDITLAGNRLQHIGATPIQINVGTFDQTSTCEGNILEGEPLACR